MMEACACSFQLMLSINVDRRKLKTVIVQNCEVKTGSCKFARHICLRNSSQTLNSVNILTFQIRLRDTTIPLKCLGP